MNGRQVPIPFLPYPTEFKQKLELGIYTRSDTDRPSLSQQIKHAVGSARSIARENHQGLDMRHISSVLEVVEAWNVAKAIK